MHGSIDLVRDPGREATDGLEFALVRGSGNGHFVYPLLLRIIVHFPCFAAKTQALSDGDRENRGLTTKGAMTQNYGIQAMNGMTV